ncbi:DUF4192 domain-containing protein [Gordonia neofelifaecis]|uniref:DUF4192 domain-containing protein n=1 Tax=Gordonia neofelifaecis NRRL B-59395 TaxID=644548 RepID=F1YMS1_9ACTN|nr:DUF4192 domain-containing protein [Gordonia neofelifaecis]EGD54006.1 hypothetical protein SCNU_16084 [Gordonia neofelifaecis NRRL B-59395]
MTNSLSIPAGGQTNGRHDPDKLLAAVPGLLGFVPERSIVLLAFSGERTVAATMRHDLCLTKAGAPSAGMRQLFIRLGALAASYRTIGTVAVIVDDRFPPDDQRYRRVAAAAHKGFRPAGGLSAAFAMAEAVAGADWHTIWRPQSGTPPHPFPGSVPDRGLLSDPNASPTALERAVNSGRRILSRRSEMEGLLSPVPHCADLLCHAEFPVPVRHQPGREDARGLEIVLAAVDRFGAGDLDLPCDEVNRLAAALVSVHVRDALLGLSLTARRGAAEDLWRALTRRLSGHARAAAATLLGHVHYMAGEGAYAGVALRVAQDADPDYNLANLLDTALANGMRPRELGGLAELAYDIAEALGTRLPPPLFEAAG